MTAQSGEPRARRRSSLADNVCGFNRRSLVSGMTHSPGLRRQDNGRTSHQVLLESPDRGMRTLRRCEPAGCRAAPHEKESIVGGVFSNTETRILAEALHAQSTLFSNSSATREVLARLPRPCRENSLPGVICLQRLEVLLPRHLHRRKAASSPRS